jgi:type II secretory pathway pseudopilin PulG
MIVMIMVCLIAIPQLLNARRAAWESRAKGALSSIGSSQLAYQGTNYEHLYGTFDALKEDMYIAEGYTLSNMIENYSMRWTCTNPHNSFRVIAFPQDTRPGYLRTFAITEDQIVRVYNPRNSENQWNSVITWDPIL